MSLLFYTVLLHPGAMAWEHSWGRQGSVPLRSTAGMSKVPCALGWAGVHIPCEHDWDRQRSLFFGTGRVLCSSASWLGQAGVHVPQGAQLGRTRSKHPGS